MCGENGKKDNVFKVLKSVTGYYSFYNDLKNVFICSAVNFSSEESKAVSFVSSGLKHLPGQLVAKVIENTTQNPPNECWFEIEDPQMIGVACFFFFYWCLPNTRPHAKKDHHVTNHFT